ncbi:MAG: DUF2723 domain-containing protein [Thermodesulfobacteriota bacterium]
MSVKGKSVASPDPWPAWMAWLPAGLGLLAAVVYLGTTGSRLGGADSAELIGASVNLGVAHPPGYPLWVTLSWLFARLLPAANVVFVYNLFSTGCFLAALVCLHRGLARLGLHPLAVFTLGVCYVLSPLNLRWLTVAEVFGLHLLLAAAGVLVSCRLLTGSALLPGAWWLGLVAGLGAANHHSLAFLVPGFLAAWLAAWRRQPERRLLLPAGGLFAGGLAVGLAFYLQPVLASLQPGGPVSCLGLAVHSAADLADLFLRRLYGTFQLASQGDASLAAWFWPRLYLLEGLASGQGLTPAAGLLAVVFPAAALWRRRAVDLVVALWLAGVFIFMAMVNAPATELVRQEIIPRMYLMPNLVAAIAALLALDTGFAALTRRDPRLPALVAVALLGLWAASWQGRETLGRQGLDVELQHGRDALMSCAPQGVLFLATDSEAFAVCFLQQVEGMRSDVLPVIWPMARSGPYRDRVAVRLRARLAAVGGEELVASLPAAMSTAALVAALVQAGVPVHTLGEPLPVPEAFSEDSGLAPVATGICLRWLPISEIPTRGAMLQANAGHLAGYLAWLRLTDLAAAGPTDSSILQQYLRRLRYLRREQGLHPELVLGGDLFRDLCLFLAAQDPADVLSDYYLGLSFFRHRRDASRAAWHLGRFLEAAPHSESFRALREHAQAIMSQLAPLPAAD